MAKDFASRGIHTPRLDAELLVARALGCDRVDLYMDLERPLNQAELERIRGYVERRRLREPIAYILGEREFFGRRFEVCPAALIPRPDTETLVERALSILPQDNVARALDLCTGCGAIAITLAAERPKLRVDATDVSAQALQLAAGNARRFGFQDRVRFFQGDLFDALKGQAERPRYDLIACNPPYIPDDQWQTLEPEITRYEPEMALLGGEDGLVYYRRICGQLKQWIVSGGTVLLELGDGQSARVAEILKAASQVTAIDFGVDLRGVKRVIEARYA